MTTFVTVTKLLPNNPSVGVLLTLGDLIALAGIKPLPGHGYDQLQEVTGACVVERPLAVYQLEPRWLAVTEGSGFVGIESNDPIARDFIRQLDFRGAAGLVIRLGAGWDTVPPAMIDEAQHLNLPLFTMAPDETPAMLLRLIHQAVGHQEIAILSRALSIQTELIDALTYPEVERELINRLSTRLGVSAILYDSAINVLASQGEAPVHLIRDQIQNESDSETNFAVGRWQVSLAPIAVPTGTYWLALAWHESAEFSHEIVRSTRFALQQLLRAHMTTQQNSRRHDLMQRAELLSEITEGVTGARLARLSDRLVLLHFQRDGVYQFHVMQRRWQNPQEASSVGNYSIGIDPTLNLIQDTAEKCGISVLLRAENEEYLILFPKNETFTRELLLRTGDFHHGTSSPFNDLTESRIPLRQAQVSLLASARSGALTPFHQVGFIDFVLAQVPAETFAEKTTEVLAGLRSNESLEETVLEFLRNGMDIQSTARSMHLHPNSIRYRLSRAEALLGCSMSDPETITLLYLALNDRLETAKIVHLGVGINGNQ
ncbi:MAG: hypothetical protein CK552_01975 [Actinobacteria bacterium]|nr:MAG: hypothetical protein CK552_01975 [Actinomycetota bacterium]